MAGVETRLLAPKLRFPGRRNLVLGAKVLISGVGNGFWEQEEISGVAIRSWAPKCSFQGSQSGFGHPPECRFRRSKSSFGGLNLDFGYRNKKI